MRRSTFVAALVSLTVAGVSLADWKADIGYTSLKTRLGAATPTGAGIDATQVEAKQNNNYMPDVNNAQFVGKTITPKSGTSGISSHATSVGSYCYGNSSSVSPGVQMIDVYEASHWYTYGCLNFIKSLPPLPEIRRIENHSWVGTATDVAGSDILRRFDLLVDRDGVVAVAGVNNGAGSEVPKLVASGYNSLTVGLTSGNSSYGPTTLDAPGRVKPDIVAPAGSTTTATPMVSSCAILLLQTADDMNILPGLNSEEQRRGKALLAKALLMAGATKTEFADWRKGFATPCTDGTVPLDYRYGAGELNIDNSHRILTAGEQNASDSGDVGLTGWDYGQISQAEPQLYFFEVPTGQYIQRHSILVAWNRHVQAETIDGVFTLVPSLANIDLRLLEADGFTPGATRDESISAIDNVEHIFLRGLGAGRYAIEVSSDMEWNYVVAWDIQLAPTSPLDFDGDGDIDDDDCDIFESCATGPGVPLGADCEEADLDTDGDVDQADFGILQRCISGSGVMPGLECMN